MLTIPNYSFKVHGLSEPMRRVKQSTAPVRLIQTVRVYLKIVVQGVSIYLRCCSGLDPCLDLLWKYSATIAADTDALCAVHKQWWK